MSGDRYLIRNQNGVYFLTFTVVNWIDVFTRKEYKITITESLNYCIENKGLIVYSWVLMSNHLHLVAQAESGFKLSDIIRDFKKFTAKAIIQQITDDIPESRKDWLLDKFEFAGKRLKRISKYKFWKDDNHALELTNNELIDQKINYIHENPVNAMIVTNPDNYLFSSAIDYSDGIGLVKITKV